VSALIAGAFVVRGSSCRELIAAFALAASLSGCGDSDGISVPTYSPGGSASQAIKLHDANGNGTLEATELSHCPGLQSALPRVDEDGNAKLTANEISARISFYKAQDLAATALHCIIMRNGQPVPSAKITLVPEEFMKDALQPASGTTDNLGRASLAPTGSTIAGVPLGMYRVHSHE
jgi:hypothetical protein